MNRKLYFSIASFIIPFIVYITTLAPGLYFIDTGELAAVCVNLGIAHPTGYPLFTLLGNIFAKIPIGDYIYRLNVMCAVLSSVTALVFFNMMHFILTELNLNKEQDKSKRFFTDEKNKLTALIISFSGSMVLAFSSTFWNTSNSLEVYSLHVLLMVTVMYLFLKAENAYVKGDYDLKHWLIFAFVLGLSFTNHLSTVFLSVGFLYLYFAVNGFSKMSFRKILLMFVPFAVALSVYVYFFVRGDNPVIAWGNPVTWDNFMRHVSGKQFSVWMFTSTGSASKQFSHFIDIFPKEFFYIPVIIAIFGLIESFIKQKRFFYFTLLLFVFNILYAINYDIHDIDTYFLLAFVVTSIWFALGLKFLFEKMKISGAAAVSLSLIIPAFSIYGNYDENNLKSSNFVKEYTNNVFNSAREKSIIMSTQWDFWVSASFYEQYVHNVRPDVVVIDKELMRKSWYLKHLKDHYPELYSRCNQEFEAYSKELNKFEKFTDNYTKPRNETDKQNLILIQTSFMNLLNSIITKNPDYAFYTTSEIEDDKNERMMKEYARIPEGMLFRYSPKMEYESTYKEPEFIFTKTNATDYYHTFLMNAYYSMYLNRASFLMNLGKIETAENLIKKALDIRPTDKTALGMQKRINDMRGLNP
ncbi:MAG: DUF2723 domain-containing protein [Candidatus Kapaibacterium sp.]